MQTGYEDGALGTLRPWAYGTLRFGPKAKSLISHGQKMKRNAGLYEGEYPFVVQN